MADDENDFNIFDTKTNFSYTTIFVICTYVRILYTVSPLEMNVYNIVGQTFVTFVKNLILDIQREILLHFRNYFVKNFKAHSVEIEFFCQSDFE